MAEIKSFAQCLWEGKSVHIATHSDSKYYMRQCDEESEVQRMRKLNEKKTTKNKNKINDEKM